MYTHIYEITYYNSVGNGKKIGNNLCPSQGLNDFDTSIKRNDKAHSSCTGKKKKNLQYMLLNEKRKITVQTHTYVYIILKEQTYIYIPIFAENIYKNIHKQKY